MPRRWDALRMSFSKFVQPATERTYRFLLEIEDSRGQPALIVRYAGAGNDAFINAIYKRPPVPGKPSAARDLLVRELNAAILAETVVTGWEHIYEDGAKEPATFSGEKAAEFLLALVHSRPAQFDRLWNVCSLEVLFREPAVASEDLGKE